VLSYSLVEGAHAAHRAELLGDVVIAVGVASRQARQLGHSLNDELLRLLIHGVLHLLGHDHEIPRDARRMRAKERALWKAAA
jgi:probable rRNA maturation factor